MRNLLIISVTLLLVANSCKWDLDFIEEPGTGLPIAEFSLNNNFCVAPCDPGFINLSQNATTFIWDWGDGTPQTTLTPADAIAHTYAAEGNYQVVLTASNGTNSSTFNLEANIFGDVVPDFNILNDGCKADCEITFQNISTGADSYEWDFGDGSGTFATSSMDDITHAYTKGGAYQVTLTATGSGASMPATKMETATINFHTFEFTTTSGNSVTGFEDQQGNFIIAGNTLGSPGDGRWIKLDKTGNLIYSKIIPTQMVLGQPAWGTDIKSIIGLSNGEMVSTGCLNCLAPPFTWSFFYHNTDGDIYETYNFLEQGTAQCFPIAAERDGKSVLQRQNGDIVGVGSHECGLSSEGRYVEFQNGTNDTVSTAASTLPYYFVYEAPSNNDIYALYNNNLGFGGIQNITNGTELPLSSFSNNFLREAYSMTESEVGLAVTGYAGEVSTDRSVLFGLTDLGLTNFSILTTLNTTGLGTGYSIITTEDEGFVLTGEMTNGGEQDVFLIKLDQSGNEEWREFYGEPGSYESGRQVIQTSDGGFLIIALAATSGFYVIKTDNMGKVN